MFRLSSLFALIAFTAWILPLGFFIKPSQEKTACDGKRAFHMCSMMGGMAKKAAPTGVALQSASGVEKSAKASAGTAGDDFLIKNRRLFFGNSLVGFREFVLTSPSNPSLYRLDAVPKA